MFFLMVDHLLCTGVSALLRNQIGGLIVLGNFASEAINMRQWLRQMRLCTK